MLKIASTSTSSNELLKIANDLKPFTEANPHEKDLLGNVLVALTKNPEIPPEIVNTIHNFPHSFISPRLQYFTAKPVPTSTQRSLCLPNAASPSYENHSAEVGDRSLGVHQTHLDEFSETDVSKSLETTRESNERPNLPKAMRLPQGQEIK